MKISGATNNASVSTFTTKRMWRNLDRSETERIPTKWSSRILQSVLVPPRASETPQQGRPRCSPLVLCPSCALDPDDQRQQTKCHKNYMPCCRLATRTYMLTKSKIQNEIWEPHVRAQNSITPKIPTESTSKIGFRTCVLCQHCTAKCLRLCDTSCFKDA